MHTAHRVLLTTALLLASLAAAPSAHAAELAIEPAGAITLDSLGRIDFQDSTFGIGPECFLHLRGSLHEGPIAKVEGALLGYITAAAHPEECIGGSFVLIQDSLPWHISYESIAGTLPEEVTSIRVLMRGWRWLITAQEPFGTTIECEYEGNALGILSVTRIAAGEYTTGLIRLDENWDIPLINQALNDGFSTCSDEMVMIGELELDPTQTLTRS